MTIQLQLIEEDNGMTPEEKDLAELKLLLRELAAEAKVTNDLGGKLIDDLAYLYDDYLAKSSREAIPATSSQEPSLTRFAAKLRYVLSEVKYVIRYGTTRPKDLLVDWFLASLEEMTRITRRHRRVLTIHKVMMMEKDGTCSLSLATRTDYLRAKISIGIAVTLGLAFCLSAGLGDAYFILLFPVSYPFADILGRFLRDAYDQAWGRDKLAHRLRKEMPWLVLRPTGD